MISPHGSDVDQACRSVHEFWECSVCSPLHSHQSSPCPLRGSGDSCDLEECGRGSRVEGEEVRQEVGGKSWSINEA